jgi:hypothetical protein
VRAPRINANAEYRLIKDIHSDTRIKAKRLASKWRTRVSEGNSKTLHPRRDNRARHAEDRDFGADIILDERTI